MKAVFLLSSQVNCCSNCLQFILVMWFCPSPPKAAVYFSLYWIWAWLYKLLLRVCICQLLSRVWLFAAPWTVVCQFPLSVEFSRQEYTGVGCHFLLQGIFPTWGSSLGCLHCRWILYHLSQQGRLWQVDDSKFDTVEALSRGNPLPPREHILSGWQLPKRKRLWPYPLFSCKSLEAPDLQVKPSQTIQSQTSQPRLEEPPNQPTESWATTNTYYFKSWSLGVVCYEKLTHTPSLHLTCMYALIPTPCLYSKIC